MDRCQFLKTSMLAAYVNPLKTVTKKESDQKTKSRKSKIVIIGARAFGGWTAFHLLNKGYDVTFDNAINSNGIYHYITHPNILEWNKNFTWSHLEYISNRKDIWHVGFGHLYLYRFISNSE